MGTCVATTDSSRQAVIYLQPEYNICGVTIMALAFHMGKGGRRGFILHKQQQPSSLVCGNLGVTPTIAKCCTKVVQLKTKNLPFHPDCDCSNVARSILSLVHCVRMGQMFPYVENGLLRLFMVRIIKHKA